MTRSTGLTEAISKQEWITPLEDRLQGALHRAFESGGEAGGRIKDALHGTWIGHPLHVILTDIPLGAWTCAMVFDALAATSAIRWMQPLMLALEWAWPGRLRQRLPG